MHSLFEILLQMYILHPHHNLQTTLINLIRTTLIFTQKFISVHIMHNSLKMPLQLYGKNLWALTMQLCNVQTEYVAKLDTLHVPLEEFHLLVLETSGKSYPLSKAKALLLLLKLPSNHLHFGKNSPSTHSTIHIAQAEILNTPTLLTTQVKTTTIHKLHSTL